jgi:hypothetical protein
MGRALLAVGATLAVSFAALGALVFIDRREDRVAVDPVLAEDISRLLALSEGANEPAALTEVTGFRWDRVLVIERGTPRELISRELGFEFKGDLPYDAESGGLFVFVRDGELARFADYRGLLELEGFERPIDAMTPAEALFTVRSGVVRPA